MIGALLVASLLAQDGGADAPLRPPELIADDGSVSVITGVEPLAPGVVCATHQQAAKERDEKVRLTSLVTTQSEQIATLNSAPPGTLKLVLAFTAAALATGIAVGIVGVCGTGHCK